MAKCKELEINQADVIELLIIRWLKLHSKIDQREITIYDHKNKRLKSKWGLLIEAVENVHSKRMNTILHTCDDVEFAKNFIKLLEYFKPKMQRVESVKELQAPLIRIEHVSK